jgi:UDP-GlcNAc:undecaprenyl-phosphate/decaprenyl-phosphate GlcNAc-1-phosphate transferase
MFAPESRLAGIEMAEPTIRAVISGFAVTAASMPLLERLALKLNITAPASARLGSKCIPVLGGPGILGGFVAATAMVSGVPLWLITGASLLCVAGLIDDSILLTPMQKLIAEFVAAVVLLALGPTLSLSGYVSLDTLIAGFWLITCANAFNLIDGSDGLAAGVGIIVAGAISLVATFHGQRALAIQSIALASALAGFLIFNFPPHRFSWGTAVHCRSVFFWECYLLERHSLWARHW